MFKNYFKIAIRSLQKNKIYTAINIAGLATGMACCMLISLYVYDEMSYDKFFEDSERIYRVALERQYPNNTRYFGSSPVNLATTLKENYDEVEEAGRLHRLFFRNQVTVNLGAQSFEEEKYLFADNDFFKVFSFDFIEGNQKTALDQPNKVVITSDIAKKYYGDEQALNKTFRLDTTTYIISGVIEDVADHSHMGFKLLGSIHSLPFLEQAAENNNWISPWLYTYIKLKEGVDPNNLESKFGDMVKTYGYPDILGRLAISEADFPKSGNAFNYFLQSVNDIHLKSNLDVEVQPNSNILYVYLLSAIVVFILLISGINFVNLATARSTERAKEVGVRKVLGSNRVSLIKQFLTESNIIALVAMLFALLIVQLVLPSFNSLVGKQLIFTSLTSPVMIIALLGFTLLTGTLAGLYPAFVLALVNPVTVLKGNYKTSGKGIWLRNFLIVFQFFISVAMISGTLMLNKQMNYIRNKSLGFNKDNVLVIEQAQVLGQQSETFKNNISQIEGVNGVGAGFAMPGDFIGNLIANSEIPQMPQIRTFTNTVDDNYMPVLNLELVDGRNFSTEFNDSLNVLINETAVQLLGYDDPVGRKIIDPSPQGGGRRELRIVGVVKDYHHHSLHTEIPPIIIFNTQSNNAPTTNIAIKINSANYQNVLQQIEATWQTIAPEQPMTYRFLDEKLQNLYEADQRTSMVFFIFTVLAIILACVGLFGLAAYVTQARTKEIGVRKVLGASILDIIIMLSKDLTKLILIAYIAAVPLVYFGMTKWFENFAYHTQIDPLTLIGAGLVTLLLSWMTISYYSIRAAIVDIAKSLRTE